MPAYQNEILGFTPTISNGKDLVIPPTGSIFGTTIDLYKETLAAGVTYTIGAFGASHQSGTMLNPAVIVADSAGQILGIQKDGPAQVPSLQEQSQDPFWLWRGVLQAPGPDPIFNFTPQQTGEYWIGVLDETNTVGTTYTLLVEAAGPPVFFSLSFA